MKKAQSLVELLLFIGLLAVFLPGLMTALVASREGRPQMEQRLQAATILKETQEQVRSVREQGWEIPFISSITKDGTTQYIPKVDGNSWKLCKPDATCVDDININFNRYVTFEEVKRDNNGNIDPLATNIDPSTIKVNTTVRWDKPFPNSKLESVMYLTRFRDNKTHIETTTADFSLPGSIFSGTTTDSNIDDGAVVLANGSGGDWCSPGTPKATRDLQGQGTPYGVVADIDRAYVGTGDNASGQPFYNVGVDSTSNDIIITPLGHYNAPNPQVKTNDVFGESKGNKRFSYIATDDHQRQVIIMDATPNSDATFLQNINLCNNDPNPQCNTQGKSIFVQNDILYISGSDSKLYTYLLSADRLTSTFKGSLPLPAIGKKIYVVGGVVFIALDSSSIQLQIVDATTPSDLKLKGNLKVSNTNGQSVTARTDTNRAYIVTSVDTHTNKAEIFIVDTTNKTSLVNSNILASYDTHNNGDMDPKALTLVSGPKLIVVGYDGDPYMVFKDLNTDKLNICGKLIGADVPNSRKINGVSSIFANNKSLSYIITEDSNNELQIIVGGPGSGGSFTHGTFLSSPFPINAINAIAFNRFIANISQPSSSTVGIRVAVAKAASGSPCSSASYYYVGPSGDPNQYFTSVNNIISGTIPFGPISTDYLNPSQCFRYEVTIDNPTGVIPGPSFNDITVNYSP